MSNTELYYVSRNLNEEQADKLAKERSDNYHVGTVMRIDEPSEWKETAFGGLWASVLSHFSTGRDKEYYLYFITNGKENIL